MRNILIICLLGCVYIQVIGAQNVTTTTANSVTSTTLKDTTSAETTSNNTVVSTTTATLKVAETPAPKIIDQLSTENKKNLNDSKSMLDNIENDIVLLSAKLSQQVEDLQQLVSMGQQFSNSTYKVDNLSKKIKGALYNVTYKVEVNAKNNIRAIESSVLQQQYGKVKINELHKKLIDYQQNIIKSSQIVDKNVVQLAALVQRTLVPKIANLKTQMNSLNVTHDNIKAELTNVAQSRAINENSIKKLNELDQQLAYHNRTKDIQLYKIAKALEYLAPKNLTTVENILQEMIINQKRIDLDLASSGKIKACTNLSRSPPTTTKAQYLMQAVRPKPQVAWNPRNTGNTAPKVYTPRPTNQQYQMKNNMAYVMPRTAAYSTPQPVGQIKSSAPNLYQPKPNQQSTPEGYEAVYQIEQSSYNNYPTQKTFMPKVPSSTYSSNPKISQQFQKEVTYIIQDSKPEKPTGNANTVYKSSAANEKYPAEQIAYEIVDPNQQNYAEPQYYINQETAVESPTKKQPKVSQEVSYVMQESIAYPHSNTNTKTSSTKMRSNTMYHNPEQQSLQPPKTNNYGAETYSQQPHQTAEVKSESNMGKLQPQTYNAAQLPNDQLTDTQNIYNAKTNQYNNNNNDQSKVYKPESYKTAEVPQLANSDKESILSRPEIYNGGAVQAESMVKSKSVDYNGYNHDQSKIYKQKLGGAEVQQLENPDRDLLSRSQIYNPEGVQAEQLLTSKTADYKVKNDDKNSYNQETYQKPNHSIEQPKTISYKPQELDPEQFTKYYQNSKSDEFVNKPESYAVDSIQKDEFELLKDDKETVTAEKQVFNTEYKSNDYNARKSMNQASYQIEGQHKKSNVETVKSRPAIYSPEELQMDQLNPSKLQNIYRNKNDAKQFMEAIGTYQENNIQKSLLQSQHMYNNQRSEPRTNYNTDYRSSYAQVSNAKISNRNKYSNY